MKTFALAFLMVLILWVVTPCFASEQFTLTTPIVQNSYRIVGINLDWEGQTITIFLKCIETGEAKGFVYHGEDADKLMKKLNKSGSKSLHKHIFEQLDTDGKLSGTVSGSPD